MAKIPSAGSLGGELYFFEGALKGKKFPLQGSLVVLSREDPDLIITGALDSRISACHARFIIQENQVWVRDLNSRNGVYVNGTRIETDVALADGDTIQFGSSVFQIRAPDEQASKMPSQIGPYSLLSIIGEGGMATVYLAKDTGGKQVALKVTNSVTTEFRNRFLQEINFLESFRHDHIVRFLDAGKITQGRLLGQLYIVMQYIDGSSLAQLHEQQPILKPGTVVHITRQIADALAYVHGTRNIIHRDIKSSNILLDQLGNAYLADFGIAKVSEEASKGQLGMTMVGKLPGTPRYMAPEQVEPKRFGGTVTYRTDIYSLGIVMYEMLTGDAPFTQATDQAILYSQVNAVPPPLRERNAEIPEPLSDIVMKCLAKQPSDRFSDAASLSAVLPVGLEEDDLPMLVRQTIAKGRNQI